MRFFMALSVLLAIPGVAHASDESDVIAADARYWEAFNRCDLPAMGPLFTDDVEFYHDKTGLTEGRTAVVASIAKGPCASPALKLRRALVPGSLHFSPLAGGYALLSGTHRFFVTRTGTVEQLDGQAQFTLLWKSVDGGWQMRRVFSFGHGPVPYVAPPAAVALPVAALQALAGRYHDAKVGDIDVSVLAGGELKLVAGPMGLTLRAESPTRFFAVERDLQFEFTVAAAPPANRLLTVTEGGKTVATAPGVPRPAPR